MTGGWGNIPMAPKVRDVELEDYKSRAKDLLEAGFDLTEFEEGFLENAAFQTYAPTEKQANTLRIIEKKYAD